MLSVRALTKGKIKENTFSDGDEVKAGDVIARLEVSVTQEEIEQLENTVNLAKRNYAELKTGKIVKVPVKRPKPKLNGKVSTLATLEERANRMNELYEMGAVSGKERDKAREDYEKAKATAPKNPVVETNPDVDFVIEYVEQYQATPPEVLSGAEKAIKQAELSLNVARQQARETDLIAPIDGIIYYNTTPENEVNAGDVSAKIGGGKDLWIEAEVSEEIFTRIPLGKLANYSIDGKNFSGTVIEKILPEEPEENSTDEVKPNDKFTIKISLPADAELKPNTQAKVEFKI